MNVFALYLNTVISRAPSQRKTNKKTDHGIRISSNSAFATNFVSAITSGLCSVHTDRRSGSSDLVQQQQQQQRQRDK